ncbi:biliverdin-producing heme oxygenase [Aeromicrobium phragmitis]|uniref:Biliverdin-producing heme oxygenase n=1 Tax=Aeromicrobium phragmitis TaxID=2478914 RepID=A0A3L8PHI8_9ACTN|nr:biliverdin-producing heme oxygenase [Aeromicrobium phragmitis]RLV54727.1 biliverdin-producing heme oxygenase [Aeromicrobium phragmitis]
MPATVHPTATPPLSVLMRDGSAIEHREAESSDFMTTMLDGRINAAGYTAYLAALRPVYAALEEVGRALSSHPVVGGLIDARLDRLASLDADLRYWSARSGCTPSDSLSPAVAGYVAHLREIETDAVLYIAHHYTRYLGDLSGGQAIGRILGRTYDIGRGDSGLTFYEFDLIDKPKPYKDAYRARLDALPLSSDEQQRVVEEVRLAFALNGAVFTELTEHLDAYTA